LSAMQTKDCWRTVKVSGRILLRHQELRLLQQHSIINRERSTKRSQDTKSKPNCICPVRLQIDFVDAFEQRGRRRRLFLAEQFSGPAIDVATIVKRHHLK